MPRRILILGGTTEARELATALARRSDLDVTVSLAGRTAAIRDQGAPLRVGGFGGAEGLAAYLRSGRLDALIDATHPYAAQISRNAGEAARSTGVPLLALHRPAWEPQPGDVWHAVEDVAAAAAALGSASRRVFLALGRKELAAFEAAPQHHYLVRSVDPVEPPPALPHARYITARGPFAEADERALLAQHRIERLVCRNSGGRAADAKLAAARVLGITVLMLQRPDLPDVPSVASAAEVVAWLDHGCPGSAG